MAKVKFNSETGKYKLSLNHTQLELIAALIAPIELGAGDGYRESAENLLVAFEKYDANFVESACENIVFGVEVDMDNMLTLRVKEKDFY